MFCGQKLLASKLTSSPPRSAKLGPAEDFTTNSGGDNPQQREEFTLAEPLLPMILKQFDPQYHEKIKFKLFSELSSSGTQTLIRSSPARDTTASGTAYSFLEHHRDFPSSSSSSLANPSSTLYQSPIFEQPRSEISSVRPLATGNAPMVRVGRRGRLLCPRCRRRKRGENVAIPLAKLLTISA